MSKKQKNDPAEFDKFINLIPDDVDLHLIPIRDDKSPGVEKGENPKNEKHRLTIEEGRRRIAEGGNVGAYPREALVVMDIDDVEKAMEYIDGEEPENTLTVGSRTDKPHLYYLRGDGIEGKDISGVIEVRTGYRYVLVPGSCAYDRKEYHEEGEKNWGLYTVENGNPLKTLTLKDLPPELRPGGTEEAELGAAEAEHRNVYGWGLEAVRSRDEKLDILLDKLHPTEDNHENCDYPSRSEADLAAMSKLLYWEFDDGEICDIMRTYRRYEKTEREDYLQRTLKKAEKKNFTTISDDVEPACWSPSEGYFYEKDGKFVPKLLADDILEERNFATHLDSEEIYVEEDGVYKRRGEQIIEEIAQEKLGSEVRNTRVREAKGAVKRGTYRRPEEFSGPKEKIPCENGIINLETGNLEEQSEDDIYLSKIPVKFNKDANCPKVDEFLEEVLNPSDIPLIEEFFGYCLYKEYPYAKAFMLLGSGANGKSTLIRLLEAFLGQENVVGPSLQDLTKDKFSKARLHGKLACTHADIPEKKLDDSGNFKMLTGGDKIEAQYKYGDRFDYYNHAKMIFSANKLPRTEDRTDAFYRRWIVIDFPKEFPEDDPGTDPNILEKLTTEEELSGLLNRALEGYQRLMEQGHFSHTKGREKIAARWIRETDSLRAFCNFALEKRKGQAIAKKDLWKHAYKSFCDEHDIYSVKEGQMTKRLPTILTFVEKRRLTVNGDRDFFWDSLGFSDEFKKDFRDTLQEVRVIAPKESDNLESSEKNAESGGDVTDVKGKSTHPLYDSRKRTNSDSKNECIYKNVEITPDASDINKKFVVVEKFMHDGREFEEDEQIISGTDLPESAVGEAKEKGYVEKIDPENSPATSDKADGNLCEICKEAMGIEREAVRKVPINGRKRWVCQQCYRERFGEEVDR